MSQRTFIDIPFGPLLPDFGGGPNPEIPGYLTDALGVRSTPNGYRGLSTFADVTSATVIGGSSFTYGLGGCFYTDAGISFFFVDGTNGKVWESRAEGTDAWGDVTPAAGTAVAGFGDLLHFGGDVIYVNYSRAAIKKTLTAAHATLFTNLAGSPPIAEHAGVVHQHVVLGNLTGVDVYAVQGCAIGNHEDWPTPGTADARSKEAFRESLNPAYGPVRRVLGGEKIGIVVQDTALTRMTYVGGSSVYTFDPYERIDAGGSAGFYSRPCTDGKLWYFYNESGMFATDGYSVQSISEGKIDEALFLNTLSHPLGTVGVEGALTSVYDHRRSLILFGGLAYVGATTYQLAYNVSTGTFSLMNENNRLAFFDGYRTSGTRNINGRMVYNINGSNRKLQRLSAAGTPTIAMQTGYIEIAPGHRVQITGAHLLGANIPSTLTLSYKAAQNYDDCDVLQSGFTDFTAASGRSLKSTARADAPFFSFRVSGTGAEAHLYRGIRVYYEVTGPIQ